jgi:soluble lytic murein transglycosylase-like protein
MRKSRVRMLQEFAILLCLIAMMVLWCREAWSADAINLDAIAQIESSGNPLAYNKASGARGLFQITRNCLRHYNSVHRKKVTMDELYDPVKNKAVAKWYINWLTTQCNDVREVLLAYNWGIGHLWEWDGRDESLPKETRDYIAKYHRLTNKSK